MIIKVPNPPQIPNEELRLPQQLQRETLINCSVKLKRSQRKNKNVMKKKMSITQIMMRRRTIVILMMKVCIKERNYFLRMKMM